MYYDAGNGISSGKCLSNVTSNMYIKMTNGERNQIIPGESQKTSGSRGMKIKEKAVPNCSAKAKIEGDILGISKSRSPNQIVVYSSSSKIWKVFTRIVSITRTCHPASAMLPPELAPIRVGLDICC